MLTLFSKKVLILRAIMLERAENKAVGKEYLGSIIAECFRKYHTTQTSMILDKIKELGFTYSTKAGITVAVSDVVVPTEKDSNP